MKSARVGIAQSLLRVSGPCSVAALMLLAWTPGVYMMRTGMLSGREEHFLAYLLSAMLLTATRPSVPLASALAFYTLLAGALELGQNLVPGRDPALFDFVASLAGAIVGIAALVLIRRPVVTA